MVPTVEIAVRWAASSTPVSASRVTVAVWPTFTLLMSDSLKATVIVIELVLTISANGVAEAEEEEDEELEPPRVPAVVPLVVPVEELDEDPPLDVEDPDAVDIKDVVLEAGIQRWFFHLVELEGASRHAAVD